MKLNKFPSDSTLNTKTTEAIIGIDGLQPSFAVRFNSWSAFYVPNISTEYVILLYLKLNIFNNFPGQVSLKLYVTFYKTSFHAISFLRVRGERLVGK